MAESTAPDVRSALGPQTWSADEFLDVLTRHSARARPFDGTAVAFCSALSHALLTDSRARGRPQLAALGYWLRPASVARMRQAYLAQVAPHTVLVPRGLVLHVTPANVDTMFVYSWVLSLLTGNVSVVRVSDRGVDATQHLLATIGSLLAEEEHAAVARRSHLVHTSHDDAVSAALSSVADVRVIWGGDETVAHFRRIPSPPRSKDVVFPDRHSLAILDVDAVNAATESELGAIGDAMFNDAYWFDQAGCSSPRLVIWNAGADVERARRRLHQAVDASLRRRGYRAETGAVLSKLVRGMRAAAGQDGVQVITPSNEATWVGLPDLTRYERDATGGGLFFEVVSKDLAHDLTDFVTTRDQTAACYGFDPATVESLAHAVNGRGIDRYVRLGRALEFDATWDGYDLCQELVRRVVVDV